MCVVTAVDTSHGGVAKTDVCRGDLSDTTAAWTSGFVTVLTGSGIAV